MSVCLQGTLLGAQWIEPAAPDQPVGLRLGASHQEPLAELEAALNDRHLQQADAGARRLQLVTGTRCFGASTLVAMRQRLETAGLSLVTVVSDNPRTRVAAAALGIGWNAPAPSTDRLGPPSQGLITSLTLHRGTVRSGDRLETAGSLLVLGDVNPGAHLQAGGHVLVWGRLRGVAHAGCRGDSGARIVALQLRPLQLRIAEVVARGPEDAPPLGMAEEARLVDGTIRIDAASPIWPLSG